jgi:peptide/nickel transport system ATP-binding protein
MVMYAGRIIEVAEKHDLLTRPRHPYTTNLLAAVPTVEGERRRRLTSIPGSPPRLDQFPSGCAFAARCALRLPVCDSVPDYIGSNRDGVACFLRQGQPSTALMGTEDKQLVH